MSLTAWPTCHPGHANREELKLMVNLTRPRYVVPVHGEYRHKELWRRMAEHFETPGIHGCPFCSLS